MKKNALLLAHAAEQGPTDLLDLDQQGRDPRLHGVTVVLDVLKVKPDGTLEEVAPRRGRSRFEMTYWLKASIAQFATETLAAGPKHLQTVIGLVKGS